MSLALEIILAFAFALVVQNVVEWFVHKYLLHELGVKKDSFFHYHWQHHNRCRKNNNFDSEYADMFAGLWSGPTKKEIFFMLLLTLVVAIPVGLAGWSLGGCSFFVTIWYYYFAHAYSHVNVALGKKLLPWHYDHHQGVDQNKNWCVSFPWFDWVMRTRIVYKYTKGSKNIL